MTLNVNEDSAESDASQSESVHGTTAMIHVEFVVKTCSIKKSM